MKEVAAVVTHICVPRQRKVMSTYPIMGRLHIAAMAAVFLRIRTKKRIISTEVPMQARVQSTMAFLLPCLPA